MAKYYGAVGYATTVEDAPGVWVEKIVERNYYGDVLRNTRKLQTSSNLNDDINVSNQISIVSDAYAMENYFAIRYVTFMGTKWKVTDVDVQYPRLTLSIGGIYNGPDPNS